MRAALAYVRTTPALRVPLVMMTLVGTLSFNFQVLLPLLASQTWHGTAATYATLTAVDGRRLGARRARGRRARTGHAAPARRQRGAVRRRRAARRGRPDAPPQALALVPLGAASVTFAAGVNSSLQLASEPAMRGRVMSLYAIVFLGSTAIGAPLIGWLAQEAGPRAGHVRRRGRGAARRRLGVGGVPRPRAAARRRLLHSVVTD